MDLTKKIRELGNSEYQLHLTGNIKDAHTLCKEYLCVFDDDSKITLNECPSFKTYLQQCEVLSAAFALSQDSNVSDDTFTEKLEEHINNFFGDIIKYFLDSKIYSRFAHEFSIREVIRVSFELCQSVKASLKQLETKILQCKNIENISELSSVLDACDAQSEAIAKFISERCISFISTGYDIATIKFLHVSFERAHNLNLDHVITTEVLSSECKQIVKLYTALYHVSVTFMKSKLNLTNNSNKIFNHVTYITSRIKPFYDWRDWKLKDTETQSIHDVIMTEEDMKSAWNRCTNQLPEIHVLYGSVDTIYTFDKYFTTLIRSRDQITFTNLRTNLNKQSSSASSEIVCFCKLIVNHIGHETGEQTSVDDLVLQRYLRRSKDCLTVLLSMINVPYRSNTNERSKLIEYFLPLNFTTWQTCTQLNNLLSKVLSDCLRCENIDQIGMNLEEDFSCSGIQEGICQTQTLIGFLDASSILQELKNMTNLNNLVAHCNKMIRFVAVHWLSYICTHVQSTLDHKILIEIAIKLFESESDTYEALLGTASKIVFRENKRLLVDIFRIGGVGMKINAFRETLTHLPQADDKLLCLEERCGPLGELTEACRKLPSEYDFVKLATMLNAIYKLVHSFIDGVGYRENLFGLGVAVKSVSQYKQISPIMLEICFNTIHGIERISEEGSLLNFSQSVQALIEKYNPFIQMLSLAI